jgi:hypothetical protein
MVLGYNCHAHEPKVVFEYHITIYGSNSTRFKLNWTTMEKRAHIFQTM